MKEKSQQAVTQYYQNYLPHKQLPSFEKMKSLNDFEVLAKKFYKESIYATFEGNQERQKQTMRIIHLLHPNPKKDAQQLISFRRNILDLSTYLYHTPLSEKKFLKENIEQTYNTIDEKISAINQEIPFELNKEDFYDKRKKLLYDDIIRETRSLEKEENAKKVLKSVRKIKNSLFEYESLRQHNKGSTRELPLQGSFLTTVYDTVENKLYSINQTEYPNIEKEILNCESNIFLYLDKISNNNNDEISMYQTSIDSIVCPDYLTTYSLEAKKAHTDKELSTIIRKIRGTEQNKRTLIEAKLFETFLQDVTFSGSDQEYDDFKLILSSLATKRNKSENPTIGAYDAIRNYLHEDFFEKDIPYRDYDDNTYLESLNTYCMHLGDLNNIHFTRNELYTLREELIPKKVYPIIKQLKNSDNMKEKEINNSLRDIDDSFQELLFLKGELDTSITELETKTYLSALYAIQELPFSTTYENYYFSLKETLEEFFGP